MQVLQLLGVSGLILGIGGTCRFLMQYYGKDCSRLHTLKSAINEYSILLIMDWLSWFTFRSFQKDTKRCTEVQEQILLKLLKDNENTEYGKKWKFSEIRSREEFQEKHPLTTYEDYRPYIERMESGGEENLLTIYPLVRLAITSGTSGSRKLLPFTTKQRGAFFLYGIAPLYRIIFGIPGFNYLQKTCKFMYFPKKRVAASGIKMGPNASSPEDSKSTMSMYTTPEIGYMEIQHEKSELYVHLLFALKDDRLGNFEANFASLIYQAFCFLENNWQSLCEDIRVGKVDHSDSWRVPPQVKKALEAHLGGPDPARADWLEREFRAGLEGIVPRIWPRIRFILTVDTGTFRIYSEKLRYYFPESIPLYSPLYAATEGLMGINLKIEKESKYVIVPRTMFYEFIPVEESDSPKRVLFADQVEVGQVYELVITNQSGLFRYRFGDVVKVIGFHNQSPMIEFQYRQGQLLSVRGEKTSELAFYEAILTVKWPSPVVDYSCIDQMYEKGEEKADVPRYSIYVELEKVPSQEELEKIAVELDEALCVTNPIYESFRVKDSIGFPSVKIVRAGTFETLKDDLINSGTGSTQVKVPRVVRTPSSTQILWDSVVLASTRTH